MQNVRGSHAFGECCGWMVETTRPCGNCHTASCGIAATGLATTATDLKTGTAVAITGMAVDSTKGCGGTRIRGALGVIALGVFGVVGHALQTLLPPGVDAMGDGSTNERLGEGRGANRTLEPPGVDVVGECFGDRSNDTEDRKGRVSRTSEDKTGAV